MENGSNRIRISVRNLVEFLFRSGDIDNRMGAGRGRELMALGAKLHRKIQRVMGAGYRAEVAFKREYCLNEYLEAGQMAPETPLYLVLEGRADGVIEEKDMTVIDEIKGVCLELSHLEESVPVHKAQALCYACMLAEERDLDRVGVQLTYCQMESEEIRRFREIWSREELRAWLARLLARYGKWARYTFERRLLRVESTKPLEFPFAYRPGQRELAVSVYRSIRRQRKLFIQAPTGIGKTMSVLFPAVKAMGEGTGEKLFYLTAKNVTREAAEEALRILRGRGLRFTSSVVTAKEKICPLEKPDCNPEACPYAKGHYDRVNEAVFSLLTRTEAVTGEDIRRTAEEFQVCPFEMGLDVTDWVDGILCDYNYVFDPRAALRRYFSEGVRGEYLFLVDEAHNLVERAREMYSASLVKEDFLAVKKLVKPYSRKLEKALENCNRQMLARKRECDSYTLYAEVDSLYLAVLKALGEMENFRAEHPGLDPGEAYRDLYFKIRDFLSIHEQAGEDYQIYGEHQKDGRFMIRLYCVHPAKNLKLCQDKALSTVFFSATLLPIAYYKELLGGEPEDYAVYAESPFETEKRLLAVSRDVSSRYTRRSEEEFERIAEEIAAMVLARPGNYMAFFPSYQYMERVEIPLTALLASETVRVIRQAPFMGEKEREAFLGEFRERVGGSLLGLCVLGGLFSEGIDLKGESLIGAAVVGTGIPQVCTEREILKAYFNRKGLSGFDYAYRFPGFNRICQAAGRVIRTTEDVGVILLLDERFLQADNRALFPREWDGYRIVGRRGLAGELKGFWGRRI
ncbi:MAG: ATP-dependent DNA helicase [Lachnospiraceae bacterium]|nr:ATP-dependent DNA helicase [Lachnospiraceae bacterium]